MLQIIDGCCVNSWHLLPDVHVVAGSKRATKLALYFRVTSNGVLLQVLVGLRSNKSVQKQNVQLKIQACDFGKNNQTVNLYENLEFKRYLIGSIVSTFAKYLQTLFHNFNFNFEVFEWLKSTLRLLHLKTLFWKQTTMETSADCSDHPSAKVSAQKNFAGAGFEPGIFVFFSQSLF